MDEVYTTLGITDTADEEQIKQAYRFLVLKYHPDKNKDPKAPALFDKITKAYNVAIENLTISSPVEEVTPEHKKTTPKGSDNTVSITINISDLINCETKTLTTKRKGLCPTCDGTGSSTKKLKKCGFCNGTGLQGLALVLGQKKKCSYCNGRAYAAAGDPCPKCKGSALVIEAVRHKIKLNPYSDRIVLQEAGNYPYYGLGKPGNLIIELNVVQDSFFKVRGLDIECEINISPAQATLGDNIVLSAFNKKIELRIPSGLKPGDVIELEQKGVAYGGKIGCFRARTRIVIPQILSSKEKRLYQELLALEKMQPDLEALGL